MTSFSWISFIFVLCYIRFSLACGDSCNTSGCTSQCQGQCTTSTCMDSCQSQCCSQSSKCCTQTNSCCSSCQKSCRTSSCYNQCQNQCCGSSKNCCEKSDCKTTVEPSVIPIRSQDSSRSSSHSGSVKADVSSNNIINNNNKINMSIGVNSNLENNIKNDITGGGGGGSNTSVIKVPVPVPSPGPGPVPVPVPQRRDCCIVIVPCVTQQCQPYRWQCGGCKSSFGYLPKNPCDGGCHKQEVWNREVCEEEEQDCTSEKVNCSECSEDFYKTYSGFSQCHGCFQGH